MKNRLTLGSLLCLMLALSGCDKLFEQPKEQIAIKAQNKVNYENLLSSSNLYGYSQMTEALNQAQNLDNLITALLHHPNPSSLEEAQTAWRKAYDAYLRVSFFARFPRFEKPQYRENAETYGVIVELLDSWPIEAGYIDYLPVYPLSGIVNDMTLRINQENLLEQHGFSDMRYASVGFHPLEFLLFGQDGKRSAKDFIPQENSIEVVEIDTREGQTEEEVAKEMAKEQEANKETNAPLGPQNHNRRREYVRVLSALIVRDLQKLADRWEPAHGYYAKQWRQPQRQINTTSIYQGVLDTVLEDILERHIQPLMQEKELEDLRSPFSASDADNIKALIIGVNQLLTAENGFIDAIKLRNAEAADKISAQLKRLLRDAKRLPTNITSKSLASRQKALGQIQKRLIGLIEQLYAGSEVLELPLKALPVSTS